MAESKFFRINEKDNVAVAVEDIEKGYNENNLTAIDNIPKGHKILLCDKKAGDDIIKYGNVIGHLKSDAKKGSFVHSHNLVTNLDNDFSYSFSENNEYSPKEENVFFDGFVRQNGKVGTRNEIWIIPTVGCVNKTVTKLEKLCSNLLIENEPCVHAFTHQFGCSQMGEDQENTRKILSSLITHPNAGGVLVVSLGCENTNIEALKPFLKDINEKRIKFLVCQDSLDEIEEGKKLINAIYDEIHNDKREKCNINKLVVGYKCGGSDAFSGITANVLCGKVNDYLTSLGATTILTEVPEMFGAEKLLMKRSLNKKVFDKQVNMINSFKKYYSSNNQVCYENPSPGNHTGGITTLEEKSLGCIQKGGESIITDVLSYGEKVKTNGLNLLTGPGNDIVSITNLASSGANLILFTTGRGTPVGSVVPTIKISSNTDLADKKPSWIDFNSFDQINNKDLSSDLVSLIIKTASGQRTKNEINDYRDISIFKSGVIL